MFYWLQRWPVLVGRVRLWKGGRTVGNRKQLFQWLSQREGMEEIMQGSLGPREQGEETETEF